MTDSRTEMDEIVGESPVVLSRDVRPDLSVSDLIAKLVEMPNDLMGYTVWIESDPSSPLIGDFRIDHNDKRVFLG